MIKSATSSPPSSRSVASVFTKTCRIPTVGIILRYLAGGKLAFNPPFYQAYPPYPQLTPRRKQGLSLCKTTACSESGGKGVSPSVSL